MLLTFAELFDMVLMTAIVGFIFSDVFQKPKSAAPGDIDSLMRQSRGFSWQNFLYAAMVVAPAIILHELGHKFVALMFGMHATFNAALGWLLVGVALKLLSFGFIFFVPAYVSITGTGTPLDFSLISFAGPAVNLVLWLGSWAVLKWGKLSRNQGIFIHLTKQVNMFLFIFNMLPIPGFDGYKVYSGLIQTFF